MVGVTLGLGVVPEAQRYWVTAASSGDSVHQQIVDNAAARLATILVANGYRTNLGTSAAVNRAHPWPTASLPGVILRDTVLVGDQDTVDQVYNRLSIKLEISARGELGAADGAGDVARAAIADVLDAIRADETFSGVAEMVSIPTQELEIFQADHGVVTVDFAFEVHYVTDRLTPTGL